MRPALPIIVFFVLSALLFFAGQNETIWQHTLGKFTGNYVHRDGQRLMEDTAFRNVTAYGMRSWDGQHYLFIRDNGYNLEKAGGDYICAFFPGFPVVLRYIPFPDIWIPLLNIVLFLAGLILLCRSLNPGFNLYWFMVGMPGLVVFALPYTESLFFFAVSLGIFGLLNKRKWLLWIGFILAACTRPSITILLLAAIGSAMVLALRYRQIKRPLFLLLNVLTPLLLGTLIAMLYQFSTGAGGLLAFFDAQSNWNHSFRIPEVVADWSHEGFGMNIATIILWAFPLLLLALPFIVLRQDDIVGVNNLEHKWLELCAVAYMLGATLFIVFFQGGSLNGAFRYALCTPMFPVAAIVLRRSVVAFPKYLSVVVLASAVIALLFAVDRLPYSGEWTFQDLGAILCAGNFGMVFLADNRKRRMKMMVQYFLLGMNAVWTAYLFNVFLSDGWIFT